VITLLLFILLLCALAMCFASNRDIFSPGKFYHMSLTVYFVDVFVSEQSGYIYAIYLGYILVGMGTSIIEAYTLSRSRIALARPEPSGMVPARFVVVLWMLSIIPIVAQCYLIHVTGGLAALAMTIAHRVGEWRGLGPLLFLIKLMTPINLVYFTIGLVYEKRHPRCWWFLYILHLTVAIVSAALMGGRSGILMRFLLMMVIYNYLRRPVKLRYALITGGVLLVIAALLGTVRQNITRIDSLDSLRDMHGDTLNLRMFSYGVNPLNAVFEREFEDYQHGKTLLTPVTNFVPRKIWPNKFESGGVVLTKFLQGRHYTGLSHMSTGVVTESILNFGYPLGILWGFALLLLLFLFVTRVYTYTVIQVPEFTGLARVYSIVLYVSLAQVPGGLLYGEFQNNIGGLFMRVILLSMVIVALRVRILPRWMFARAAASVREGRL
jgi:hypothetical protein